VKKYYVGVEAEGPFKGAITLFIASDEASLEDVRKMITPDIQNIYFGAQYTYGVPDKYIPIIKEERVWRNIIIEINKIEQVKDIIDLIQSKNVHVVLSINGEVDLLGLNNLLLKVENEKELIVYKLTKAGFTSLNDIRYSLDKEIFP